MIALSKLAEQVNQALPQTQCRRCTYEDCAAYARAIASDGAPINQCPPGGEEGIARLAAVTGRAVIPLSTAHGTEGPLLVARINEAACIGCRLCVDVCPVDCVVGASKLMHSVVEGLCTGCELCVPVCPVDCISLHAVDAHKAGWTAWSQAQADQARERYAWHRQRGERDRSERDAALAAKGSARAKLSAAP